MRPFKHVANPSGRPPHQNILGIDLARFRAPWGEVPLVATTEAGRITLYYWNDREARWDAFEQIHEPLNFEGETPDAPPGWNWSDRVAVACSATTVHVVYKRAIVQASGMQTAIFLDRYQPEDATPGATNRGLRRVDSRILVSPQTANGDIGRSLWSGCDPRSGDLLVLYQVRPGPPVVELPEPGIGVIPGLAPPADWQLTLLRVIIDASGQVSSSATEVDRGGFDLDARLAGTQLLAVYRRTSEAFRIPLAMLLGGGRRLTSGTDADAFYEPLQLATIDTQTMQVTTEALPGGEHPQIQRTAPLLITMNRPAQLDLLLDPPVMPLPPGRPRALWAESPMDKLAWLRDGSETFRGTLLSSGRRTIPRSHAGMSEVTHLFQDRQGLLVHAGPFRNFPVHVLDMARAEKELTVDVLHHRDFIGLFRTRLRAAVSDGVLSVEQAAFEVWDIGHAQIENPDALTPSADGETAQFEPTGGLALARSRAGAVQPTRADNTMGGHLAADTGSMPVSFFAYTDLGDGCLRVIFAPDIPTLAEPPPVEDEKVLRPEQVTGPHLRCDEWVELPAADFTDSGLIGYQVGIGKTNRSLGSSIEAPIDFLLDACAQVSAEGSGPGGAPLNPLEGLSRPQFGAVDDFRVRPLPPLVLAATTTDNRALTVTVTPGAFIAGVVVNLAAQVDGAAPPNALWTLTPLSALIIPLPGPVTPGMLGVNVGAQQVAVGNPAIMPVPFAGAWRLSASLPGAAGGAQSGAGIDVTVQPSVYDLVTALYTGVADTEFYRIGNLSLTALQYDIGYEVAAGDERPTLVKIIGRITRGTELRFAGGGLGQGVAEARAVLSFATEQLALKVGLDWLFTVKSFGLTIRYGRPFTPGMLMSDQRSRGILDGEPLGDNPADTVPRDEPRRHAGIGAKPFGDARISDHDIAIEIEMTPLAIVGPPLVAALTIMGAFSLAQTVAGLIGLGIAAAALGAAGIAIGIVVAVALAVIIAVAIPPLAEDFAKSQVEAQFTSGRILEELNRQPLIRYAGEGAAEAIARQVLDKAGEMGFNVPAPAGASDAQVGLDRMHGQLFQMVFVSDGVCRVLIRQDDCPEPVETSEPPEPEPPGEEEPGVPGFGTGG